MTITERLALINAGYTKEEIAGFEGEADPKPDEPKHTDPKPEEPKPEDPKPENNNDAVLSAIEALTKAIQLSNVQKSGTDGNGAMSAADALAKGVFGNK